MTSIFNDQISCVHSTPIISKTFIRWESKAAVELNASENVKKQVIFPLEFDSITNRSQYSWLNNENGLTADGGKAL